MDNIYSMFDVGLGMMMSFGVIYCAGRMEPDRPWRVFLIKVGICGWLLYFATFFFEPSRTYAISLEILRAITLGVLAMRFRFRIDKEEKLEKALLLKALAEGGDLSKPGH